MTIVVAVSRDKNTDRVVQEASELATDLKEPLHVIHVLSESEYINLERTSVERTGKAIERDKIETIAENVANKAVEAIDQPIETVGLVGNPAEEIIRYGQTVDARYLVVGGRKRSPIGKALFGSVTQGVLLDADRPVLTILSGDD